MFKGLRTTAAQQQACLAAVTNSSVADIQRKSWRDSFTVVAAVGIAAVHESSALMAPSLNSQDKD